MHLSTVCNVRINLRSIVRRTAGITLAGKPNGGHEQQQQVTHCTDLVALHVGVVRNSRIVTRQPSCPATNPGIDMSKPSLQLIHSSNGDRAGVKRSQNGGGFRPHVIHGGATSVPGLGSWEAALELIDFGFLVCYGNYLAFLEASTTVFGRPNRTDAEKTS
jgi:hypothetical protein